MSQDPGTPNITPEVVNGNINNAIPNPQKAPDPSQSSWTASLPDDVRGYAELKGFKDVSSVVEAYRNFEKIRGVPQERLLTLPEKADAPEWGSVYERLGKPAKKEDYKIGGKSGQDTEFANWAKEVFHGANLSTKQAETISAKWEEFGSAVSEKQAQAFNQKMEQEVLSLKKEWGQAYDQQVQAAKQAVSAFGIDEQTVDKLESVLGHQKLMKMFSEIGSKVGEGEFITGKSGNGFNGVMTPAAAKEKIKMLQADKTWGAKYVSGDADARQEFANLHKMAFGA